MNYDSYLINSNPMLWAEDLKEIECKECGILFKPDSEEEEAFALCLECGCEHEVEIKNNVCLDCGQEVF